MDEKKDKPKAKKKITVAVRDFALPLKRSGSLGGSSFSSTLPIDLGQEIHTIIQNRLTLESDNYQPELSLQTLLTGERFDIRIRGRLDGIFKSPIPLIEEIKSSFGMASLKKAIELDPEHPYLLQTRLYGYIYYLKYNRTADLQLRLVDSRTLAEEIVAVSFELATFEKWVLARQKQIEEDIATYAALVKKRKRLAARLYFPFKNQRPKQEDLVAQVKQSLEGKRQLLVQAPTGLGKTAAVLYPALVHALSQGSPVVYVAPKNSQFKAAVDLGQVFQRSRIPLKVLVLTSKTKACQRDEVLCQNSSCPFSINYHDKVEENKLRARDEKKHLWDYRYFQKLSEQYEICPYEIGMERIRAADLIICDYNYIFSPHANFLDRYLDPILPMRKPLLVIDEAHNLYERVIENYSPEVRLSLLKEFFSKTLIKDEAFNKVIDQAIRLMKTLSPPASSAKIKTDGEAIKELLSKTLSLMTARWGGEGLPGSEDPLFQFFTLWFDLNEMINVSQEAIPLIYKRENGDEILKAQCIDPSALIAPIYANFLGVVAFSATLKPFAFYQHMSGFDPQTSEAVEFGSPFPREHKKIMVIPQVQTNYRERDRHYQRIALIMERVIDLQPGPYLAFFSSYQFLRSVEAELPKGKDWQLFSQSSSLSGAGIQKIMDLLEDGEGTRLIMAVQGGSLSEGIDFRGMGLRGVFVVGPAVPSATFERRLMQEHFEQLAGNGRAYAYVYPSMTRSVQAAGRIVRDETERGIIILMDPRFVEKDYAEAMPEDWYKDSAKELIPTQILAEIKDFWDHKDEGSELSLMAKGKDDEDSLSI
jgi:DNA excision repair protein ERCC-2